MEKTNHQAKLRNKFDYNHTQQSARNLTLITYIWLIDFNGTSGLILKTQSELREVQASSSSTLHRHFNGSINTTLERKVRTNRSNGDRPTYKWLETQHALRAPHQSSEKKTNNQRNFERNSTIIAHSKALEFNTRHVWLIDWLIGFSGMSRFILHLEVKELRTLYIYILSFCVVDS